MSIPTVIETADEEICGLLAEGVCRGASDLHLAAGAPPAYRIDGALRFSDRAALTAADTKRLFLSMTPELGDILRQRREIDAAVSFVGGRRCRMNAFFQRQSISIALRLIAREIPTLDQMNFPNILKKMISLNHGLILVSGMAGSGKSTTLAAMIDWINRTRAVHILTLEEPIEFLHQSRKSLVQQREIPYDSRSFAAALRAVLREDPDVIMIGELRDAETAATVLTAAETGHLVLASLHTAGAAHAVDRILDLFAPSCQQQARRQLSMILGGVVSQRLLPAAGHGRIAAQEIMIATPAVRSMIREGKTQQLQSAMQSGGGWGMQTMEQAIAVLAAERRIFPQREAGFDRLGEENDL